MAKVRWQRISKSGLVLTGVLLLCSGILSFWISGGQLNQVQAQQSMNNADPYEAALAHVYDQAFGADDEANGRSVAEPIQPIPLTLPLDPQKVALGDRLFHDPQLSGDRSMSCATCHSNALGGADGRTVSISGSRANDSLEKLNTPTVWNSAFSFRQLWDGRIASLEAQVDGPLLNPTEMNNSWAEVITRLGRDESYRKAFQALYPHGIEPDAVRQAIATYERSLITPNARFDQFLKGDESAITAEEKKGYDLFKGYGCVACHQGVNIGGNMFQRLGIMEDYFLARGNVQKVDLGRMNITGRKRDHYVFKVPSLRNIELTAPYLHDGSVKTLEESVYIMGKYQLGREIPKEDTAAIVSFLRTLTGSLTDEVPAHTAEGR